MVPAGRLAVSGMIRPLTGQPALAAVAAAFGVRSHAVTLVAGAASRTKIADVAGADPAVHRRVPASSPLPPRGVGSPLGSAPQAGGDLLVPGLGEVPIELADPAKRLPRAQPHHLCRSPPD